MTDEAKEMTVEQLKARAYDLLAILETCKQQLVTINGEIARRAEEEKAKDNK